MRGCTSGGARSQRADPAESSGLGVGERYGPCVHDELERSRGGARWGATAASHFWARTGQGFALCSQMRDVFRFRPLTQKGKISPPSPWVVQFWGGPGG